MITVAWRVASLLFAMLVIAGVVVYWVATGPENLSQYPDADTSPYVLPWTGGNTFLCVQSNRGVVSHRGWEQFAYDFAMPVGTNIRAARAGEVIQVVVAHDGNGYQWPNNLIAVRHDDGTLAYYLHLKKDGSRVQVGDRVAQGQVVAVSGNVGNSMIPHLHFHVTDPQRKSTQPITFADLDGDLGIPRMFKWYKKPCAAPERKESE